MRTAKPPPAPELGTRLRIPPGGYARIAREVTKLDFMLAQLYREIPQANATNETGRGVLAQMKRLETSMKIELIAEDDLGPEIVEL